MYNPEFLKESQESPFWNNPDIPILNSFNQQIVTFYQSLSDRFNTFEIALQIYFRHLTRLRLQYILLAVNELDSIMQESAQKQQEKNAYKMQLQQKLKS